MLREPTVMNLGEIDYPALTDEAIEEARKLIGVSLRRNLHQHVSRATRGAVLGWARASTGDRNSFYLDDYHAWTSRYGGFVAPPLWLYDVDDTMIAPKLPAIHSIYAAADWEFFRTVRLGDTITVDARLADVIEKQGQFCGRMVMQVGEVNYRNQRRELVATCISKTMRTPRKAAQKHGKYNSWQKHLYSSQELINTEEGYDKESWRGDNIRYWEDTGVGEELPPIVRGPLTGDDSGSFVRVPSYRRFFEYLDRHPCYAFKDPASNAWEGWENELKDDNVARSMGFPFAHDCGFQRICILGNLVTNWMGDDAFLVKIGAELRLPWIWGDTMWAKGKVMKKYVDGRRHLVDLEIWLENEVGTLNTAHSYATAELRSKSVPDEERTLR